jgi:flagellin-like hook-associated protein FlgL
MTTIASLNGVTAPLGLIRLTNAGQTRDVDLSAAVTVQDLTNIVQGAGLGIRVEISEGGDRLSFINELSGGSMSIGEVAGGQTATQLGVRSYAGATLLADFNDGRGVDIITGSVDPISGAPDPAADVDFQVTLRDGSSFDVDLAGAVNVQDVITLTNAAAFAAGFGGFDPGATFFARLAPDGNGLELIDNSVGAGSLTVANANGSRAAEQLGIVGSTTGASLTGTDRATVAADGVFSHLIALREALAANDETGIEIASERLELDLRRVAEARAEVGVRARRVSDSILRQEDLRIQDMGLRSQVQDLDYTEAAVRFSTLQQQLQAGLTVASQMSTLSLLDFLR